MDNFTPPELTGQQKENNDLFQKWIADLLNYKLEGNAENDGIIVMHILRHPIGDGFMCKVGGIINDNGGAIEQILIKCGNDDNGIALAIMEAGQHLMADHFAGPVGAVISGLETAFPGIEIVPAFHVETVCNCPACVERRKTVN
jgi:hypothetical protein